MKKKLLFVFFLLLMGVFINVKAFNNTLLNVDFPRSSSNVNNELLVQGWVMSETDNNISISIDGKPITSLINRNEREDVLAAVTGYGGDRNKTPGFQTFIDISKYDYGKHSLKIEALDSNNKLLASEQREFIIKAPATLLNVDFPKYDSTNKDSIVCKGTLNNNSELKAMYISTDANIVQGDSVETSGLGGIYPKGIHVGTIGKIVSTKNITDRYAIVNTAVDFNKLNTVLVIKNN